ncbi:MAG TPA: SRPBCC domain-containing protein [Candidatus Saccharimonadales bacterium]|nr:SRPBCC domain-containing protein [Candidatus Saccharimonadales bacterium]
MSQTKFEVDKEKLEVRITRDFNATPKRLWQAHTQPEQIVKWWADTVIDKFELRVGGQWRFISRGRGGQEYAFRGQFLELDEPNKIVRTFEYEPFAGHDMTELVVFKPLPGGRTRQITVSKYKSLSDLEGMVATGMEHGASVGLDRLAKLVERN